MAVTALQTIRNGVLAIGVCASLAGGSLGFSSRAEARVPEGDRVSFTAQYCGELQDEFDKATSLQWKLYWIQLWQAEGCEDHYGDIGFRRAPRGSNIVTGVDTVSPGRSPGRAPVGATSEVGLLTPGS